MSFDFRVVLNSFSATTPLDATFLASVQADAEAALRYYGKYFQGLGTFDLQISFESSGPSILAAAEANAYLPTTVGPDGLRLLKPVWLDEFQTGRDRNGIDVPEGLIVVNSDQIQRFWFDPTPDDRSDAAPFGRSDFLAIVTHELGHIFGFDGVRNLDGSFPTDARTVYDEHTTTDGFYDSAAMRAATGGRAAIDTTHGAGSKWFHLADPADLLFWQENRTRTLTLADFAVLHDEGMVSATPDAGNNVWFGIDGASDVVDGGAGADILFGLDGNDTIAGGAGFDLAGFSAARAAATVVRNGDGSVTVAGPDGIDTLRDVEALRFADKTLFAVTGADATIARLYAAAFARAPDAAGLAVQIDTLHLGITPQQLASNFIASAEFVARYGSNASDRDFVKLLYNNVLGRDPDDAGYQHQLDSIAQLGRPQLLLNFADSAENQAKVTGDWLLA
ncbi:MAG: outer rane calcium-binding protein [Rhodospirillales bacterium]|nr:outer rane calcium-binding protein [Rhodospirillales bacterium]